MALSLVPAIDQACVQKSRFGVGISVHHCTIGCGTVLGVANTQRRCVHMGNCRHECRFHPGGDDGVDVPTCICCCFCQYPPSTFFMSTHAMPVYTALRGSRRLAFSPVCAYGQMVQSWQKRLWHGNT